MSEGNGYILAKSTKKSAKSVKEWIVDGSGYEWNEKGTFKVKSKIRKRIIKDEHGKKVEITEKPVSYTHLDVYKRQHQGNALTVEIESFLKDGSRQQVPMQQHLFFEPLECSRSNLKVHVLPDKPF